ncbi:MAG: polysaccharide pyruvyl transferase family protein [Victivallaceae bacterium]
MKEISLIGATFYGNRGAEAMLSTSISMLRVTEPGIAFNVFSYYPDKDRQLVNAKDVTIYPATPAYLVSVLIPTAILYRLFGIMHLKFIQASFPASVRALSRSRLLICLAGVSFIDRREKFLPFNIATILPAMILGVPVVKFAQAVGPFRNRITQFAARHILARCRQVFARGDKTFEHLADFFPDAGFYQRADDIAFLFCPEFCQSTKADNIEERLVLVNDF